MESFTKKFPFSNFTKFCEIVNYQRISKDIVISLLYPAVLGTIIYNTVTGLGQVSSYEYKNWVALFTLVVIIIHYVVDYMYTIYFENYSVLAFVLDMLVIGLMLLSTSYVEINQGVVDTRMISLCFSLTYFLFITIDLIVLRKQGNPRITLTIFVETIIFSMFLCYHFYLSNTSLLLVFIGMASLALFCVSPKPIWNSTNTPLTNSGVSTDLSIPDMTNGTTMNNSVQKPLLKQITFSLSFRIRTSRK